MFAGPRLLDPRQTLRYQESQRRSVRWLVKRDFLGYGGRGGLPGTGLKDSARELSNMGEDSKGNRDEHLVL